MLRLAYIAMTGNPIDFGLEKIIILLNSKKFQSIRIGWLAFIIFNITDEISLIPNYSHMKMKQFNAYHSQLFLKFLVE